MFILRPEILSLIVLGYLGMCPEIVPKVEAHHDRLGNAGECDRPYPQKPSEV